MEILKRYIEIEWKALREADVIRDQVIESVTSLNMDLLPISNGWVLHDGEQPQPLVYQIKLGKDLLAFVEMYFGYYETYPCVHVWVKIDRGPYGSKLENLKMLNNQCIETQLIHISIDEFRVAFCRPVINRAFICDPVVKAISNAVKGVTTLWAEKRARIVPRKDNHES